ncbi:MAG: DUF1800 domain-containing protein [Chloroflexi bacterium]|nr:DUF1800 domain-containing protein [Chloroflexota bacterium]
MQVTRRDFLTGVAGTTALAGLPAWILQLDESSLADITSSPHSVFPWQWTPPGDLGAGNPILTALNRLAFGPRPGDFERAQKIGVDAYIEEQLAPEQIDDSALEQRLATMYPTLSQSAAELMRDYPQRPPQTPTPSAKTEPAQTPQEVIAQLQDATILRALASRRQLREVLVDFWSNHFSIFAGKNDCRWLKTIDDREVIRRHAFGKFGDLLLASAQSPAMLVYLDNQLNVKGVANENYAREIMELHTLGVDSGYTQKDVAELARAFTGWTVRPPRRIGAANTLDYTDAGTFFFDRNRHDNAGKRVLGIDLPANGGINDALKIIDALAKHPSTAQFISKKLVRRFVADAPPDALAQRAAQTFTQTNGDIRAVLSTILHSDEFGKNSFAQKIKRPFEFVVSAARAVDLQADDVRALSTVVRLMGQGLFLRPTPDGYPDVGTAWLNTSGLLARWNFAFALAYNRVPRAQVDLAALIATSPSPLKATTQVVDFWADALLHRALPDAERQKLIDAIGGKATANFDPTRLPELVALILASPHFQYR